MCRRPLLILSVFLWLFLSLMLGVAFNVPLVRGGGTIYIRADGSVYPSDAPISSVDNITYVFTDNINESIVVERDNIVVDGAGYTVQGAGSGTGVTLSGRSNVTIKKMEIKQFDCGIELSHFSNNITISRNNITENNYHAIKIYESSNNSIYENNLIANKEYYGLWLYNSSNNSISGNNIANNYGGIGLYESSNYTSIYGNDITENSNYGIVLFKSSNIIIYGNNLTENNYGIRLFESSSNFIYHNNFVNNTIQVYLSNSVSVWDDGYPSGGNYWSDYTGVDEYSGPFQNETGSDGMGDTPYIIDVDNQDGYPLISPWPSGPGFHELEVSLKAPTSLPPGDSTLLEATVSNLGFGDEQDVSLFLFLDNVTVNSTTISLLEAGSSYTINYFWTPTTDGVYNVTAYATPVSGEIYVANNRETALVTVGILPPVQNVDTGLYYDTIQEAIDAPETLDGHIISVKAGTYYEHLTIDKSLKIVGEGRINTIIDGNKTGTSVVAIIANNTVLSGFTIRNSSEESTPAIRLESSNNVISNNKIVDVGWGIYALSVSNNTIENNIITNNVYGIYLEWATLHMVKNNTIADHQQVGIYLRESRNNVLSQNIIDDNLYGIGLEAYSNSNRFYHNNFVNNTSSGFAIDSDSNTWDDDYPSGGNYWSDYAGVDFFSGPYQNLTGSDGIGDVPYIFSGSNQDKYPLMNPMGSPQPPIAIFTYSPEDPMQGEAVTFNATLSYDRDGTIMSYSWDFGDDNMTSVTTPTIAHVYSAAGDFIVNLTVSDNDGLSHSIIKSITVVEDSTPPITLHDYDGLWHTADFFINLSATDDMSGVAETYYILNGDPPKIVSADGQPLITAEGGNNTLEYWSVDNAGNIEPHKILTDIKLDKTAPSGYILINNDEDYTTTLNVTLSLWASDATSGVSEMRLSNDGANWTAWETYATSRAWNLSSGEGIKIVYVEYKDVAGLVSPTYNDTIMVRSDVSPPVTTISVSGVEGNNGWFTSGVTVTLSATDDVSGVDKTEYSFDNVVWIVYATPFSIVQEGDTSVYYRSTDKAGNVEAVRAETVKIDKTAPSGFIVINNGDVYSTLASVTLTLTASDDTSGVYQVRYSDDGEWDIEPWEEFSATKEWVLPPGDGIKTVYYQIRDIAGLVSETSSDAIILDTTPPAGSITIAEGAAYTNSTSVTLTLSADDTTSGVSAMRFSHDNVTWTVWEDYAVFRNWDLLAGDGMKNVYAQFKDKAGLISRSYADAIILDTVLPSGSVSIAEGSMYTNTTSVTLTLSATDATSGVVKMRFSNDNVTWSDWEAYATSKLWILPTGDGIKGVTVQYRDNAGLVSSSSDLIILDTTKPSADAGPNQTVAEDTLVTFNGSDSWDENGIAGYAWAFIDVTPQIVNGKNPSYTFETPGTYTVTLTVADNAGNLATDVVVITVLDISKPTANGGADRTVDEDTLVPLDGSASSDNVGVTAYTWTFTDVTIKTLTGEKVSYAFSTPGVYTITLNVTDAAGNWATDTIVVTVLDITKPVANAGQNQTVYVGESVSFDADLSSDNVGIVSYEWDFGDGTTGAGVQTTHSYASSGTYKVILTVKDAAGNLGVDSIIIEVLSPPTDGALFIVTIVVATIAGLTIALTTVLLFRKRK